MIGNGKLCSEHPKKKSCDFCRCGFNEEIKKNFRRVKERKCPYFYSIRDERGGEKRVAKFSKEISKDFFCEQEEHYYFHLKDTSHEFTMGLKEILLCLLFAEDEGLIPKAPENWWSFLYSTYNVPHEQHSPNFKEGFHNGFWDAIELMKRKGKKEYLIDQLEEKYLKLNSSDFFDAIDTEWENE